MSSRPQSAENNAKRNSRLNSYLARERPFSAPSAAHGLPAIRDGGRVRPPDTATRAPPQAHHHPRPAFARLPDAKAMGMVESSKETSTIRSTSLPSEELSSVPDSVDVRLMETHKAFAHYDEALSDTPPSCIAIDPLEAIEPKRMRRFVSTLSACRRLLRQAWGGKRERHKLEKSFLVYEAEKLKETIAKADALDLSLLTDDFWRAADELVATAQRTVLAKTADSSFAGNKSLITQPLVDAMNKEKPLFRVQANTSFKHARHAPLPATVTCSGMHSDANVLYVGCVDGGVYSYDMDADTTTPLDFGFVYEVTDILCAPLRRMGTPLRTYVVAAGFDKSVRVYCLEQQKLVNLFIGAHTGCISAMCVWGGLLLTAGYDGRLLVWNIYRSESRELIPQKTVENERGDCVTALHPHGPLLIIGFRSGAVGMYATPDTAALNSTFGTPPIRMCFVFDKGDVVRRDIPVAARERALRGGNPLTIIWAIRLKKEPRAHHGPVTCLALRDDMCTLFTGGADGHVCKWQLQHKQQSWRVKVHCLTVTSVLPMAKALLLTTSLDGLVKIWDDDRVMLVQVSPPMSREVLAIRQTHYRVPTDPNAPVKKTNKRVDQGQLVSVAAEARVTLWDFAFQY